MGAPPDIDVVVIGAGVVGLAVARAAALSGLSVALLEQEARPGQHSSSRNSEVIHAGLYYPTDSLKARLCVTGKQALYDYCGDHGVPYRRCGKLVVASDDAESERLAALLANGQANGVHDLTLLGEEQVHRLAPAVRATSALLSPSTGIIDSEAYLASLQRDLDDLGGMTVCHARFQRASDDGGAYRVQFQDNNGDQAITCAALVNAAGMFASDVAACILPEHGLPFPQTRYARGNYFTLSGQSPADMLIYPLPDDHGLGIHLTIDLDGNARFGPDVDWIETIDYSVDETRKPEFVRAVQRYLPQLQPGQLKPGWSGIRPKAFIDGSPSADFIINDAADQGFPGLIQLFGIDSPGLTASLALADHVVNRIS